MIGTNDLKIPNNEEAERKVIATCIDAGDSTHYDSINQIIDADDFYVHSHKILFQSIQTICSEDKPLNETSMMEQLKTVHGIDEIGGATGLMYILDNVTTPLDFLFCAKTVAEKSNLRKIIRICRLARERAESESVESSDISLQVQSDLEQKSKYNSEELCLASASEQIKNDIDATLNGTDILDVIKTHIGRLDTMLGSGGIAKGEVVTIAAPTSCGKSALALNIALSASYKQKKGVGIFSLEMPQKQLAKRMSQTLSGINYNTIDTTPDGLDRATKFKQFANRLSDMPIFTSHHVKSADDLASQARKMVKNFGVKLLIIDYLQLIPFDSKKMSKTEGISNISHRVKQIALELDVGIVLLAQVNREGARRDSGLTLYDLKDSGDIENDADVVVLMYPSKGDYESSKMRDSRGDYTQLIYKIAKNREGERDIGCLFKFYHCVGRFE
tara:strand:- start:17723 stop:19057 length:1335 start_codon:yes stop_codon:yes gene_type:complete